MTDDKLDLDELERLTSLACEHIDDATPCLCDDCYRLWAALRTDAPRLFERVRGLEKDADAYDEALNYWHSASMQADKELETLRARIAELERQAEELTSKNEAQLASILEERTLLIEQNKALQESATYCASCGLLAPSHESGCGRWVEIVKALERERDGLREALEKVREEVRDLSWCAPDVYKTVLDALRFSEKAP